MTLGIAKCETKLCGYLDSIHVAVAQIDLGKKRIEFCNNLCHDLFGQVPEDERFSHFSGFLSLTDTDSTVPFKSQSKRVIHGSYLLSVHTIPVSEKIALVFLQDVTDIVRLESILEAVNIMDNIGYIFSGIRHEIGNPINTIKMTMSVLKKNLSSLSSEKIESYINRSLEEIVRLEDLLQSLKSYNMFDKPRPKNLHLPSFIDKFISLVEQDFSTKGVNFKIMTYGELYATVDPRGLQQVMLNVITNAFDALQQVENPTIVITLYSFVNQICIKVTDNGCGINDAQQANLFQPFYTTKTKGTGLGLVISKKILQNMNCSIRIHSVCDKGTSVIICMPKGVRDE